MENKIWVGVPKEKNDKWNVIFGNELSKPILSEPCPVCGQKKLRRYYEIISFQNFVSRGQKYIGKGGGWEWCKNCYSYSHFSAAIPDGWLDVLAGIQKPMSKITPDDFDRLYDLIGL